jgi:hypothetical protein
VLEEWRLQMAKPVARLKLFVSSTSELEAERVLINEIVAGVNRVIEELCGATIRLVDWRRDVVPIAKMGSPHPCAYGTVVP